MNSIPSFVPVNAPSAPTADAFTDAVSGGTSSSAFAGALDRATRVRESNDLDAASAEKAEKKRREKEDVERPTADSSGATGETSSGTSALRALLARASLESSGVTTRVDAQLTDRAAREAAGSDPSTVFRDPALLQPEFRSKVERVVQRMKGETGADVTIRESWRSQTRQNALYDQGRSTSGPVVTWTQNSRHSSGLAADLVVSGGSSSQYAALQQIANEEGLRTLGAKDPGHVELNLGALQQQTGASVLRAEISLATPGQPGAQGAQLAQVAAVAQVAQVADVAHVAGVAAPGVAAPGVAAPGVAAPGVAAPGGASKSDATAAATGAGASVRSAKSSRSSRSSRSSSESRDDSGNSGSSGNSGNGARTPQAIGLSSLGSPVNTGGVSAPRFVAPLPSDAAARVDRVLALQDARAAQPMNQMLLRVDNGAGGEDRIRIGTIGARVGATIDLADPALAAQIGLRASELGKTLAARGLSMDALRVRGTSGPASTSNDLLNALIANGDLAPTPSRRRTGDTTG
ncbi:MAG: M15 family metallopeptidase, partial [Gemmatimonadetes bacterium]|nr:M15 family metallopeptidase [Gemmatimonadota bacterium]